MKSARVSLFAGFFLSGDVTEIALMYRVKQIGIESIVVLRDVMGLQDIALPVNKEVAFNERVNLTRQFKNEFRERIDMIKKDNPDCINPVSFQYFLKFEIIDVYPGSSWDDTCISDMLPRDMTTDPVSGDEIIRRVYVTEEKSKVLFDTDIRSEMVLVDMKKLKEYRETGQGVSMAITLMDVSKDNEWARVDFMFSASGARVEEYPVLYQVRSGRRVESDILNNPGGMTGFSEKNGKIFLDTDKGPVDLEVIKKKLIDKH